MDLPYNVACGCTYFKKAAKLALPSFENIILVSQSVHPVTSVEKIARINDEKLF